MPGSGAGATAGAGTAGGKGTPFREFPGGGGGTGGAAGAGVIGTSADWEGRASASGLPDGTAPGGRGMPSAVRKFAPGSRPYH